MNLPRIIILGVIAIVIIIFIASILVSRYIVRNGEEEPTPTPTEVVTPPEASPTLTPTPPQDIGGAITEQTPIPQRPDRDVLNLPVVLTQTEVQRVISSHAFWTGPVGTDIKSIIVVYPQPINFTKDQQLKVSGVIRSIDEIDRSGWNLTADEEAQIRERGTYLRATEVKPL